MLDRAWELAEHDRRIANLLRVGVISEVDLTQSPPAARVQLDADWVCDFLPWIDVAAGPGFSTWSAPEVGEQVKVFAPSGEPGCGIIIRGLFSTQNPPPSLDPNVTVLGRWNDGGLDTYDRSAHARTITIPAGGSLTIQVGSAEVLVQDGKVTVQAAEVDLGAAGGQPVARVGDSVNLQTGKIISGSNLVKAA